ncbi:MAG: toxin [Bacteroidetes bacterium]|nr:toxin [Bacteroidota bacterium]MCL5737569.1 toxin [Bacteroidota bacterium]
MKVIWDKGKEEKLVRERNISLEEIAELLMNKQYLEILENSRHPNQMIFILSYKDYTHAVPFVIDAQGAIVLKTAYPSRKHHKLYGGTSHEGKAR